MQSERFFLYRAEDKGWAVRSTGAVDFHEPFYSHELF